MLTITAPAFPTLTTLLPALCDLLTACVDTGASIGFVPPLAADEARAYWRGRLEAVERGAAVLLVAHQGERVVGTAQLALESRANGRHRAEVQKVLVHPEQRRQGIARRLMEAIEQQAQTHQRWLLFLDTRSGDPAEALYQGMGYVRVGSIPQFALNGEGVFDPTTLYYKLLR